MKREPRWVPRIVLEAAHLDQLREHGGLAGLRDEGGLEAALARPRQKWAYDPKVDLAHLAAAYAFGIAKGHPFRDGNKRAALLAMLVFLGLNGRDLEASETEVVQVMVALAEGSLTESALAEWLRTRIVSASP